MASVTSLDKDLRNLRLEKYTPQRANETREWIENVLGVPLAEGDLLDALKDGQALCQLVNLAVGPATVRFKKSSMPFVQMENISHFLRACQSPPIDLQSHDCFLTVDLYEGKDGGQVLQCISAFSRRANALQPSKFPTSIGAKAASSVAGTNNSYGHDRRASNASQDSNSTYSSSTYRGRVSPSRGTTASPTGATSWAKKSDVGNTAPAWNIAQYGWTGGASQGNQGVSFGGRRQIVSSAPNVPSLAEKERKRREAEAEAERKKSEAKELESQRRAEREAGEQRAKIEEARRWEEETTKQREREKLEIEEEKRRWQAQELKWKEEEEMRQQEEKAAETRLDRQRQMRRAESDQRLQGQFLSQYRTEQQQKEVSESDRIKELERQLEEAKERERRYEEERKGLSVPSTSTEAPAMLAASVAAPPEPPHSLKASVEDEWQDSERNYLRQEWSANQITPPKPPRPLPVPGTKPAALPSQQIPTSSRPLPVPGAKSSTSPPQQPPISSRSLPTPVPITKPLSFSRPALPPASSRPLPDPSAYAAQTTAPKPAPSQSRTDSFLASNPAPPAFLPASHIPLEASHSSTAESDAEAARRLASQQKTKAGGWASKSLLEREMERERERQKEWEEEQRHTKETAESGSIDPSSGTGPGQSWDVNAYGYMGGDNLNKGGGVHSGRRQVLGPRPLGGK